MSNPSDDEIKAFFADSHATRFHDSAVDAAAVEAVRHFVALAVAEERAATQPKADPGAWLILDSRSREYALWWGPNRSGYTVRLDEAGRYTEAEARSQEQSRSTDKAVPLAMAERHALSVVSLFKMESEMATVKGERQ